MRYKILLSLLLGISILYLIPVPQKEFSQLYPKQDAIQESLLNFRKHALSSVEVDGITWQYVRLGHSSKTLLFLHGMGGSYDIWWQQINALKDEFSIISLSLPAINSLEKAKKGINAILHAEGIDKFTIVGTSMGGYIAQYYMHAQPERVEKLVLGNTFPPNNLFTEQNGGLRKVLPFIPEWYIMRDFRNNLSKRVTPFSENSPLVEAYLLEQYYGLMSKKQFIGRMDIVLEEANFQATSASRNIPKLIIEADNDPLIPADLREALKDLYPEANVYTFHGKGHFEYLNAAMEYENVLREFFGTDLKTHSDILTELSSSGF